MKAKPFSLIAALLFVTVFAADPAHSQQQRGASSSSQINSMPAARSNFSGQGAGQITRPSASGNYNPSHTRFKSQIGSVDNYNPSHTRERNKSQLGSVDNKIKSNAAEIERSRRSQDAQKERVQQSKKDVADKRRDMQRAIDCLSLSGC